LDRLKFIAFLHLKGDARATYKMRKKSVRKKERNLFKNGYRQQNLLIYYQDTCNEFNERLNERRFYGKQLTIVFK